MKESFWYASSRDFVGYEKPLSETDAMERADSAATIGHLRQIFQDKASGQPPFDLTIGSDALWMLPEIQKMPIFRIKAEKNRTCDPIGRITLQFEDELVTLFHRRCIYIPDIFETSPPSLPFKDGSLPVT